VSRDDWKRFGSPYDPGYSGKMQNPEQKRQQEREDQYRVRGCGDPNCSFCNSHIPSEVASSMSRSSGRDNYSYRSLTEDAILRAMQNSIFGREEYILQPSRSTRSAGPPASYTAARKEVEKWLMTAPEQSFDDIVGNEEALEQLRDAIRAPVEHKAVYDAYGMKSPKGALLSGPPGCGKTMFARAAASEMKKLYGSKKGVEFISISGSELQAPYVGVTESYIKAIFTFAREYKAYHGHPLLVFMDEAEVLLPDRTGRVRRVAPWEESQVATFLAEMDGITESGAFIMLATNRPEVIDQAVLRDGRCDFKIVVKRPTPEALKVILQKNFAKSKLLKDKLDDLVFTALECFQDPHKVIVDFHMLGLGIDEDMMPELKHDHRHFLLEHIVSGAMAASVPIRATRYAFARDKLVKKPKGVVVADVVKAVSDIYQENKSLDHSFALEEFRAEFKAELIAKYGDKAPPKSKMN
jgi:SpoVK/Ycf46/Vps4 family AAA+-type ATPase